MPTPSHQARGSSERIRWIKFSCFGEPSATKTISGAQLSADRRPASSRRGHPQIRPFGQYVPTIFKSAFAFLRMIAAASAVPGEPPSKKIDRPLPAASRLSDDEQDRIQQLLRQGGVP